MIIDSQTNLYSYSDTHRIVIPSNLEGHMNDGVGKHVSLKYPGIEDDYMEALKYMGPNNYFVFRLTSYPNFIMLPIKSSPKDRLEPGKIVDAIMQLKAFQDKGIALPELSGKGLSWSEIDKIVRPVLETFTCEVVIVHPIK